MIRKCDEMTKAKQQIHILDDDASVCRSLALLLSGYGYHVKTYSTADEYFSDVPRDAPGCLVLDIHMPVFNGWHTMERLLQSGSQRPVIVITADKNGGLKERALQAKAIGFLQKPFTGEELVALIRLAFETVGKKM